MERQKSINWKGRIRTRNMNEAKLVGIIVDPYTGEIIERYPMVVEITRASGHVVRNYYDMVTGIGKTHHNGDVIENVPVPEYKKFFFEL